MILVFLARILLTFNIFLFSYNFCVAIETQVRTTQTGVQSKDQFE